MTRMSQAEFDAGLDEHQARQRELAARSEALGEQKAKRPHAEHETITFEQLVVGDYMTAEADRGADARWVKVVEICTHKPRRPGQITVTFQVPEPIGVAMETRWVIDRDPTTPVVIDAVERRLQAAIDCEVS